MNYPLISEYIESILYAEDNFATLTNLRPVLDDAGQPIMSSGNFAVVFKMQDVETQKTFAIKCFLKEQDGRDNAYELISQELESVDSPYLVSINYLQKELFVDSASCDVNEFPVLQMDWVDGIPLDKYLTSIIDDKTSCEMLSCCFGRMAYWLLQQSFSHGDLKPDNILVRENGMLVLVDYDGMFVPKMEGQYARELGSPDFRHPNKQPFDFDCHSDDFALSSIALSLKAISIKPSLYSEYCKPDRLLFSEKDYVDFAHSNVFNSVLQLASNRELNGILKNFISVCCGNCLIEEDFNAFIQLLPYPRKEHIELLECLMDSGDTEAQSMYGLRLIEGNLIKKNETKGIYLIYDAISKGCARAINTLGVLYREGTIVEKNTRKSIELLKEASAKGCVIASRNIGLYSIFDKDYNNAILWLSKAAEYGFAPAQYKLGACYYHGNGIKQDYKIAIKWFEKAAEQNESQSQYALGVCYDNGNGVEKDYKTAIQWYEKAAKQNNPRAQHNLGSCYYNGNGVEKDYKTAIQWFEKAAEQNYPPAQHNLGVCYDNGDGVEKDHKTAIQWYEKAAEQNNPRAQYNLGVCYYYVEKDYKTATQWFEKAAKQNNPRAQHDLGVCYYYGYGVEKNHNYAVKLFTKAADQGYELSIKFLEKIESGNKSRTK